MKLLISLILGANNMTHFAVFIPALFKSDFSMASPFIKYIFSKKAMVFHNFLFGRSFDKITIVGNIFFGKFFYLNGFIKSIIL